MMRPDFKAGDIVRFRHDVQGQWPLTVGKVFQSDGVERLDVIGHDKDGRLQGLSAPSTNFVLWEGRK